MNQRIIPNQKVQINGLLSNLFQSDAIEYQQTLKELQSKGKILTVAGSVDYGQQILELSSPSGSQFINLSFEENYLEMTLLFKGRSIKVPYYQLFSKFKDRFLRAFEILAR